MTQAPKSSESCIWHGAHRRHHWRRHRGDAAAAGCDGATGHGRCPDVRGRPAVAEADPRRGTARHDHRRLGRRARQPLGRPSRRLDAAQQREGRGAQSADRGLLQGGSAGAGVQSGRRPDPCLGRPWAPATSGRNRCTASSSTTRAMSGSAATAPRMLPDPEVHPGRQVPGAVRASGQEHGQQRSGELRTRGAALYRSQDQRRLRCRRLPQPTPRGDRRRHRQDQALVGRLWQEARRWRARARTRRRPRRRNNIATPCTASRSRRTACSMSATA